MPKRKRTPKKDPNRPKRALTSFMFFASEKRKELLEQNPSLKVTEIGKKLGELWRALSPEEKKKYEALHNEDSDRYKQQMENYVAPVEPYDSDPDVARRRRKRAKDPNRPKRSLSSFMFFSIEKRSDVTKEFPDIKITEVGKKLAEKWRALNPAERKKYEDLADDDRDRYRKEMESYNPPSFVIFPNPFLQPRVDEEVSDEGSASDGDE